MQIVRAVVVAVLFGLVGGAAVASAQEGAAPPGNSGIDQYRESAPPSGGGDDLSTQQRRELREQGSDGEDLEAVLERSGGVAQSAPRQGDGGSAPRRPAEGRDRDRDDAVDGERDSGSADGRRGDDPPSGDDDVIRTSEAASSESLLTVRLGFVPLWTLLALVAVGCVGAAAVRLGRAR